MNRPKSVTAAAMVQFLGSGAALLSSGLFLWSEIDRYRLSRRLVEIYGRGSGFDFLNLSFYFVYIIFPGAFGILGAKCASGLFQLREWSRKATIFLSTVAVLCCTLLV